MKKRLHIQPILFIFITVLVVTLPLGLYYVLSPSSTSATSAVAFGGNPTFTPFNNRLITHPDADQETPGRGTQPVGLNARGNVVGKYVDPAGNSRGFLLNSEGFKEINFPDAQTTEAYGINNLGHIAGIFFDQDGMGHGFLLNGDPGDRGAYTAIDVPGALTTYAADINDRGWLVGSFVNEADGRVLGYWMDTNDGSITVIDLDPENGVDDTIINGISNEGIIVGGVGDFNPLDPGGHTCLAFTLDLVSNPDPKSAQTFGVPGALTTVGMGINKYGNISGFYEGEVGGTQGFLADDSNPVPVDMGTNDPIVVAGINDNNEVVAFSNDPDNRASVGYIAAFPRVITHPNADQQTPGRGTQPVGLNNRGDIVGKYVDFAGNAHGFLFNSDGFIDIDFPNAQATEAYGINNRGHVVGIFFDQDGMGHGFLLNGDPGNPNAYMPIDVPGALTTYAADINDRGWLVGSFVNEADGRVLGYWMDINDGIINVIDIDEENGIDDTIVNGINNIGIIVGGVGDFDPLVPAGHTCLAFIYDIVSNPDPTSAQTFRIPNARTTVAMGINRYGNMSGYYEVDTNGTRGFVGQMNSTLRIHIGGDYPFVLAGINDHNQVVTFFNDPNNSPSIGFLASLPQLRQVFLPTILRVASPVTLPIQQNLQ